VSFLFRSKHVSFPAVDTNIMQVAFIICIRLSVVFTRDRLQLYRQQVLLSAY